MAGEFSTRIRLKTDGYPIGFHLTGGEASDSRNFEVLLDLGPDVDPRAVVADKGYDAKTNREAARNRGICPVIPYLEHHRQAEVLHEGPLQSAGANRANDGQDRRDR
ncbi:MAG: transposase [Methylocella sp.]